MTFISVYLLTIILLYRCIVFYMIYFICNLTKKDSVLTKIYHLFEENWLREFNVFIDTNIQKADFQLQDICDELNISQSKLYRLVIKLTGLTPGKYITQKKLKKAKEMLEVGIFPTVKETAFKVGFERPEHFTKLFRKEYGILPSVILKG